MIEVQEFRGLTLVRHCIEVAPFRLSATCFAFADSHLPSSEGRSHADTLIVQTLLLLRHLIILDVLRVWLTPLNKGVTARDDRGTRVPGVDTGADLYRSRTLPPVCDLLRIRRQSPSRGHASHPAIRLVHDPNPRQAYKLSFAVPPYHSRCTPCVAHPFE